MDKNYQLGLLYLVHLLVSADGVVDEKELAALDKIKTREKISDAVFGQFKTDITIKKERDIYQSGLEFLSKCTNEQRLQAFAILYKMSEVDGRVHVKEVRLLLYSTKMTGVEFDDVVKQASTMPSFY
ncbi:MAG TPA: TerB family tellurite resistance protein [Cyclobacteriaceae bacterium]|nr:TerB family tellurite resistance protein [Cyclobacteriaceae bacterium]